MKILTAAPVEIGDASGALPEFGRCPDVQRLFGIKRGKLYALIQAGLIQSVSLREPGKKFGTRLIHLASVREYLTGLMNEQTNGKP